MKTTYKILILAFSLIFTADVIFASGGNRTGTGGAAQLLIPVGARSISMGGANIASATGIEALFWNPAGVAKTRNNVDVTFSHMSYIADIGVEYGAVGARIEGFGILSFNVKALSVGDILITTTTDPDGTGSTYSPQMMTAGLGFSRALTDNISIGIVGTLIRETLGDVDATGYAFNIGIIYDNLADISGLSFGIAIKNLGPQMQFDGSGLLYESSVDNFNRPPQLAKYQSAPFELPSQFELGFAYTPLFDNINSLIISTSYQNNNFSADEYKVGGEYTFNNTLFVRGGYTFAPQVEGDEYIYGLTAGMGIKYDMSGMELKADYAFREVDIFDSNHVFSVSIGF